MDYTAGKCLMNEALHLRFSLAPLALFLTVWAGRYHFKPLPWAWYFNTKDET